MPAEMAQDIPELPSELLFRLDARDQVLAHLKDGRYFPLSHPVVQALLFRHFRRANGRDPKRREMRGLNYNCTAAAADFRPQIRPEAGVQDPRLLWLEDFMERETVIPATLLLLRYELKMNRLPWKGRLTDLRNELDELADSNGLDRSEWPGGKHFGEHILLTLSGFWPQYNVRVSYHRKKCIREYCLDWIDRASVIRQMVDEELMTQDDATGALFASPEVQGDDMTEEEAADMRDGVSEFGPVPPPFTKKRPRRD